jgi:hypothetical protein
MLDGVKLRAIPQRSERVQRCPLPHVEYYVLLNVLARLTGQDKEINDVKTGARNQIMSIDAMILCREKPNTTTKNC